MFSAFLVFIDCFSYVIPSAILTRILLTTLIFSSVGGLKLRGILVVGFLKVYCRLLYFVSLGFLTGIL